MEKKRRVLKPGALTAPLPPAVVSVGDLENHNVLTVAWTGILATVPPKTYISVRPSRHSHAILREKGEFVINLPSADMAKTVDFVGIYTGAKMDKFKKCGLTAIPSEKVAAPTIKECPVALECRVTDVLPMGSHDVFLADIVSVSCAEDIMDEDGKMHFERANLLAYAHGEYYSLGERLGRFGFSTDKTEKKDNKPKAKSSEAPKREEHLKESEKEPFYQKIAGKSSSQKKKSGKNKGAPHGKRRGSGK